jgi:pilus assembly protein TadC
VSNWLTAILVGGIVAMFVSPFILLVAWLPMRRKAAGEEVSRRERMAVLRNAGIALLAVVVVVAAGFLLLRKDAPPAPPPTPPGMSGGTAGS